MRRKKVYLGFALLILASCNGICDKIPPCGDFTFTGTIFDTSTSNGINMNLRFNFNPADCGSDCSCDTVCYVQMVRTYAFDGGTYLYPSSEKSNRATAYGWYIDRLEGKIWGYYGRNDNGSFASSLVPGTNTTDAILYDSPRRGEGSPYLGIWWQAVSVPVCIDGDSGCHDFMLGSYFWSWLVNDAGTVTGIVKTEAWEPLDTHFDDAVAEWNVQAPTLGKNTFPVFSSF